MIVIKFIIFLVLDGVLCFVVVCCLREFEVYWFEFLYFNGIIILYNFILNEMLIYSGIDNNFIVLNLEVYIFYGLWFIVCI